MATPSAPGPPPNGNSAPTAFRSSPPGLPNLLQHPTPSTTSPAANGSSQAQPLIHATKSRPLPPLTKVTVHINNGPVQNGSNTPAGEVGGFQVTPAGNGLPTSKTSFGPNVQAPGRTGGKHHLPLSPVSSTHPAMKTGMTTVVSSGRCSWTSISVPMDCPF